MSLILISLFCIFFGFSEIIEFGNPKINKRISAIGYLYQAIFHSRMFWFKNYVQWNKTGILIRIKSFFGKSISFENVIDSKLENNILTIYEYNGKNYNFDLTEIDEKDSQKLSNIINKYCY